ncbi:MAG: hypothetical protein C5B53_13220 [Candidatus Melainabacteria bacterium]|nr:MAG: hypothetical protein C5B53_13220 [Candidatus Melainabacteria bacterium]
MTTRSPELPKRLTDATDADASSASALEAKAKLQKCSLKLREDGVQPDQPKRTTGDLTDLTLVRADKPKEGDKPAGLPSGDKPTVTRDGDKFTVTINGKTQTFTAEELMKAGKGPSGSIDAKDITIDENGKVKLLGKDGSSATLGFATKPDGSIVARTDVITESNGSTHAFEYGKSSDPTFVTKWTDTVKTFDGKTLTWTNTRVNDTDRFIREEPNGDKHYITDVKFNERGQMTYRGDDLMDKMLDKIFGENWLTAGDLGAAREHFLQLAGKAGLFKGDNKKVEEAVDRFIARCHQQGKVGVKQPSDDQIASALRHLSSVFEASSTALKGSALTDGVEKCLLSLSNPQKYCNQGQIGSCYLNSILFLGEMASPDRVAKAYASIITTGQYRGLKFDSSDMGPLAGQDRFNHAMTTLLGKTFGFRHMTPAFRGTTTPEAEHAYQTIFGSKFPVFNLGQRQDKAAFDRAIAKYGGVVAITLGGAHAQVVSKDSQGRYRLENWWGGQAGMEGTISPSRLFRT